MQSGVTIEDTDLMARLTEAMRDIKDKVVNVGWFDTAVYPNGQQVAYVAAIQEFGAPEQNIPARPFILPTYNAEKDGWRDLLQEGAHSILEGMSSAKDVLVKVGGLAATEIAVAITGVVDPELAPSTIQARLERAGINQTATDTNVTRTFNAQGEIDEYQIDGTSRGLIGKPLIDTGYMLATLSFDVGGDRQTWNGQTP